MRNTNSRNYTTLKNNAMFTFSCMPSLCYTELLINITYRKNTAIIKTIAINKKMDMIHM